MKRCLLLLSLAAVALGIASAQPVISTASPLTAATNGTAYSQTFAATGGTAPYTWSVTAGILPPGLALNANTGVLAGVPTLTGRHFGFTIQAKDAGALTGTKAFDMHVYAKFTYGNPYKTPPNCTHTNNIYGTGDLNTCTVPGEVPLGAFSIPAVGQSLTDSTFGTQIKVLGAFPSQTAYYDPSAFSASGRYAAIEINQQTTIISPATGQVIRPNAPGFISNQTIEWDANDDDKYYWPTHQGKLMMASVATGVAVPLIDFNTTIDPRTGALFQPAPCTAPCTPTVWLDNGGTGDISKDNWMAMYTDQTTHLAIVVNLNNLHIYTADYTITRNGGVTPNWVQLSANGFVMMSRGIDSVSNKRYILVETNPAMVIYSLPAVETGNGGSLNYERLGPEMPTNSFDKKYAGNDNNICEPNESCWLEGHGTTFEDSDGQQYYVWIDGQGLNYKASTDGESRGIEYARFNAGDLMLRSAAYEAGGGRTDAWLEYSVVQAGDPYMDNHPGCAKHSAYCVVSQDPPNRVWADLTSPLVHTAHDGNIAVIKGLGQEIRTLLYARTIVWAGVNYHITNISNTSPVVVTTQSAAPSIQEGMEICIVNTGTSQDRAISHQCYDAHILSSTTFSLKNPDGTDTAAGGTPTSYTSICTQPDGSCGATLTATGLIARITNMTATNPVTVTTNVPNTTVVGGPVYFYNTGLSIDVTGANGQSFTVLSKPTPTTFTFATSNFGTPTSYTANCFGNPASTPCGAHIGVQDQYWPRQFASISGDGSRILYNSNFGHYTYDSSDTVLTALTGFNPPPSEDVLSRMCSTYGSLSTCTNLPVNTWVDVTATGATTLSTTPSTDPAKSEQWYLTAWDKALFPPLIDSMCLLGSYRTHSSEPNEAYMCHQVLENRLSLWGLLESWHNEEFLEGAHPMGIVNIDPTSSTTIGQYGYSCAQVADCPRLGNHREDFFGQAGRPTWPGLSSDTTNGTASLTGGQQLGSAAYDPVKHTLYGLGGSSTATQPFWSLDRDTNLLNTTAASSGAESSSALYQSFAYSNADGKIYVWGGSIGSSVTSNLYRFTGSTGVWEFLGNGAGVGTGGNYTCNVSQVTGVAACPSGRMRAGWTYDSSRNLFTMFGGWDDRAGCNPAIPGSTCTVVNDLWQYNPVANSWTQLNPACNVASCNGGSPRIYAGAPTNERFQYIPELDVYWDMENSTTAIAETPHLWFYRTNPGPPIGYLQKSYTYTVSPTAAIGSTTGSLNHFTNSATQQSWANPGAITTDGNGDLWWGWSETSVVDTYTATVAPYLHPYVTTWSAAGGVLNVPSGANSFSIYNGDTANGLNQVFNVNMNVVAGAPWICYTWVNPGQNSSVECKGWNGTAWAGGSLPKIGTPNQASDYAAKPYLVSAGGNPTVAWIERNKNAGGVIGTTGLASAIGYVYQYIGGSWNNPVGPPLNSGSQIDSLALVTDGTMGNLYAAYTVLTPSTANGNTAVLQSPTQLFLVKWNSVASTWDVQCGGAGNRLANGKAFDVDATWMNGQPYLAWTERTGNSNTPQVIVATCSGGAWSTLVTDLRKSGVLTEAGGLSAAMGFPYRPRITNDGANLFVTWSEQANGQPWLSSSANQTSFNQKPHVYAAQVSAAGTVTYLGGALNVDTANGSANHPSIAMLSPGNPVVFWAEVNAGNFKQVYVKQWTGTDWAGLQPPVFSITTGSPLPSGINGQAYSVQIQTASGTGNLTACSAGAGFPAWASITFSGTTCTISGTPNLIATSTFTVTAVDSGSHTANQTYQLAVVSGFSITTSSPLSPGTVGSVYAATIGTSGGSGTAQSCTIIAGSLPAWASISTQFSGCLISGTPNLIGTSSFTVQITDTASNVASQAYTITITSSCAISTSSPLAAGTIGSAYSQTIATTGCLAPVTFSVGHGLPAGLALNATTGVLSGTPTGPAGTSTFTVTALDAANAAPQMTFSQTINAAACTAPAIQTTSPLPNGTLNNPYSTALVASGTAPITWSATGLPGWASLDTVAGIISGTPNASGTATINITATNSCGSAGPIALSLTIPTSNSGTAVKGTATLTGTVNK